MKTFLALIPLVALACVSIPSARGPASIPAVDANLEEFFDRSPTASPTCAQFFALLHGAKVPPSSVQSALEILRSAYPDYFKHYSLLPHSESIQGSSWQYPRAVVYGGDASMVLTFNGSSKQAGYGEIELMCKAPDSDRLSFREVVFPKESVGDMPTLTAEEVKQPFVITPPDRETGLRDCRNCHGSPAHPLWDTYDIWPSAYGVLDDSMQGGYREGNRNDNPLNRKIMAAEAKGWRTFSRIDRYAVLPEYDGDRHNLAAGILLDIRNSRRIVDELKSAGASVEAVKLPLARALYCPPKASSSPAVSMLRSYAHYNQRKAERVVQIYGAIPSEYESGYVNSPLNNCVTTSPPPAYDGLSAEESKYLVLLGNDEAELLQRLAAADRILNPRGIYISNWSMDFDNGGDGNFNFENGNGGPRGSSFLQTLDMPFLDAFFSNNDRLKRAVAARRAEPDHYKDSNEEEVTQKLDAAICAEIR